MKIENAKLTKREFLERFFDEHSDEVFTTSELREKLGFDPRSMLYTMKEKNKIGFLSLGGKNTYFGSQDAIEKLEKRVETKWKSMK